ncbi:MAG TPA: transcriptional regulator [Solibacterales bacterium]|nr:transcriptional regulator [Bryobacterales bacterium]
MRTLSKKTQYALRALYALARARGRWLLISELASHERIPKKFLEQILLKLKAKGLVASKKGKGGGYQLAEDPRLVTLGQVIRLVEGPLGPLPCASEPERQKCDECEDDRYCETRLVMREIRDQTARILDGTSLADACRRADEARAECERGAELMYYI